MTETNPGRRPKWNQAAMRIPNPSRLGRPELVWLDKLTTMELMIDTGRDVVSTTYGIDEA